MSQINTGSVVVNESGGVFLITSESLQSNLSARGEVFLFHRAAALTGTPGAYTELDAKKVKPATFNGHNFTAHEIVPLLVKAGVVFEAFARPKIELEILREQVALLTKKVEGQTANV